MALLPEVFLCDLQLNGCTRLPQVGEQRRSRLADLEIDWAVLDLHDHVIVELSIKRFEEVDGGFGTIFAVIRKC